MHNLSLASEHIETVVDGFLSPQELQVEHALGNFRVVRNILDFHVVVLHLVLCDVNQVSHVCDFSFELLNHSHEWLRTGLAVFRKIKDFALEGVAHARNLVLHQGSLLVD